MTTTYMLKLHCLPMCIKYFNKLEKIERFRLQDVQMVNITSSFKTKNIGNNTEARKVNRNTLRCFTLPRPRRQTSCYILQLGQYWTYELAPFLECVRSVITYRWDLTLSLRDPLDGVTVANVDSSMSVAVKCTIYID